MTAASDVRKSIVLLAFETMEKIVRDYFPYITETETTTFTDCVKCLIAFTNSRFNNDASLNAIAFLRFCAVKLADGGLVCYDNNSEGHLGNGDGSDGNLIEKDDHAFFWFPLLEGTHFHFPCFSHYTIENVVCANYPETFQVYPS